MRTLISGGTVVNSDGSTQADVLIDGETIAAVGRDLGATVDRTIGLTLVCRLQAYEDTPG